MFQQNDQSNHIVTIIGILDISMILRNIDCLKANLIYCEKEYID